MKQKRGIENSKINKRERLDESTCFDDIDVGCDGEGS